MAQNPPTQIGQVAQVHAPGAIPFVRAGQPIYDSHMNAIVGRVNALSGANIRTGEFPLHGQSAGMTAIVANKTEYIFDVGHCMRLHGQERYNPTDHPDLTLSGHRFEADDDLTRFGICAERIDPNTTGRVYIFGACMARVLQPGYEYTVTVPGDPDDTPVEGATVSVYADVSQNYLIESQLSDSDGLVTFNLSSGTYYVWVAGLGYTWVNPDFIEVDAGVTTHASPQPEKQRMVLGASGLAQVLWSHLGWAVLRFPVGAEAAQSTANWQYVWNEG